MGERIQTGGGVGVVARVNGQSDAEWSQRLDQLEAEIQRGLCRVRRLGPFYIITRRP
jgi:hypothetical protein